MAKALDEDHPLLNERLRRARTVFAPGNKMRMNVIPMFLAVFIPWVIYSIMSHVASFEMMHNRRLVAVPLLGAFGIGWLILCGVAAERRKRDADPTWFTFFAVMVGLAVFCSLFFGIYNYQRNTSKYYSMQDMKIMSHVDPDLERGQNVMDAGVFYFADGSKIDPTKSWHFMAGTLYCVAPITASRGKPATMSYDFWAVGKDCCSYSSADFRCGDFADPKARSAIRIFNEDDIQNYRLAVMQAETLYDIMGTHPIFVEWHEDPIGVMHHWISLGFRLWLKSVAGFFVFCLFAMVMATAQYSFLGRRESVYEQSVLDAPAWAHMGDHDRSF